MMQPNTPLVFDEWGYLVPAQPIVTTLDHFRETFGFNEHRQTLLQQHADLLVDLRRLELAGAEQWVNGSFVTQKSYPNDMDLVTFIPFRQHQQLEGELRERFAAYPNLDAYAVRVFPDDHRSHFLTNLDKMEWLSLFTQSRKDRRTNRRHPKGCVCLTID
ncbi:DUF6932 family protein [Spirosoma arcticum]